MKSFVRAAAVAVLGVSALSGCGALDKPTSADAAAATAPAAAPSTSASAVSKLGSVKDSGTIPDPCELLSDAEVEHLTGRKITQKDHDDKPAGDAARFCQWQQESGQLAVFLSRTTSADFEITIKGSEPVDGVGQDAFSLAGHLYVLYGTVSVDVYSYGDSDAENLAKEKDIAKVLLPKI